MSILHPIYTHHMFACSEILQLKKEYVVVQNKYTPLYIYIYIQAILLLFIIVLQFPFSLQSFNAVEYGNKIHLIISILIV